MEWGQGDSHYDSNHLSEWNGVPTNCNIPRDSIEEERDLGESSQCNVSDAKGGLYHG